jgi:hypothetical protein
MARLLLTLFLALAAISAAAVTATPTGPVVTRSGLGTASLPCTGSCTRPSVPVARWRAH